VFGALWSPRTSSDPEAAAYIGPTGSAWDGFVQTKTGDGFGLVAADIRMVPGSPAPPAPGHAVTAVAWKGAPAATVGLYNVPAYEAALAAEHAGKLQVSVDVVAGPGASMAEARRLNMVAEAARYDDAVRTEPAKLSNWYMRGAQHFRAGMDAEAIRDFSHYIEKGGETGPDAWKLGVAYTDRAVAAARLGRKQDAQGFLQESFEFDGKDRFRDLFRRACAAAVAEPDDAILEGFEQSAREWAQTDWAPSRVASAYGYAAGRVRDTDPRRFQAYVDKAVVFIGQAIQNGLKEPWWFSDWPESRLILDDPRIQKMHVGLELDQFLPIKAARRGDARAARQELEKFLQSGADAQEKLWIEAITATFLGDDERALERVEARIAGTPDVDNLRFSARFGRSPWLRSPSPRHIPTAPGLTPIAPSRCSCGEHRASIPTGPKSTTGNC